MYGNACNTLRAVAFTSQGLDSAGFRREEENAVANFSQLLDAFAPTLVDMCIRTATYLYAHRRTSAPIE